VTAIVLALSLFDPLVGGQWVSTSKLPNGETMRSRTVWTRGAGLVRMRRFEAGGKGEVQRYETVIASRGKTVVYRLFSAAGLLARGTVTEVDGRIVLEQPPMRGFPAMRTAYEVDGDGCIARVSFEGSEGWKQRLETRLRREKLGTYKQLDVGEGPLSDLAPFVGARYQHEVVAEGAWSLHGRLLRIVDRRGGKVVAERYVAKDAKSGKTCVVCVRRGAMSEGEVEKEGKVFTWRFPEVLLRCRVAAGGLHEWTREGGPWLGLPESWISRRKEREE